MLPMIAGVGCVIDYTTATMIKTKLQAAADAASLATVSVNSSVITTAKNMTGNGTVSGGSTFANNFFNANLTTAPDNRLHESVSTARPFQKADTTITATVSFTAKVPTYFMGIMGFSNVAISGTSTASYTLPTYIDFYLMLDVSGSMSFPSTTAEQPRLMAVNPDNLNGSNGYPGGCTFACHFTAQGACAQSAPSEPVSRTDPRRGYKATNPSPGGYCQGFIISRLGRRPVSFTAGRTIQPMATASIGPIRQVTSCSTAGTTSCIQLRADAVGYAVNTLAVDAPEQRAGHQLNSGSASIRSSNTSYSYFPADHQPQHSTGSPARSITRPRNWRRCWTPATMQLSAPAARISKMPFRA